MKRVVKKILKITGITIASLLGLVVLLLLLLRLPAVQNFVTHKVVSFLSDKTHTRIELHRLYIGFPKMVVIEGLYAEDLQHDTLLSLQKLAVNVDMLALLKKKVSVSSLELSGVNANILRGPDSLFNFNFFIKAFASGDTTPKPVKVKDPADTTGWQIDVGKVQLQNIRARFYDEIGGTEVKGYIGSLALNMKAIDIKHLNFEGNELALSNADVTFEQSKHGPDKEPDTSIVLMPLLSLKKLDLQQVKFKYSDGHTNFSINAGTLSLLPDTIDLNEHIIKVNKLHLQNTQSAFSMQKSEADTVAKKMETEARKGKGWQVGVNDLKLDSVDFNLDMIGTPRQPGSFDYNHIGLQNVHIDISNGHYSPDVIYANIKNISLREQSGVVIKQFTAQGVYDDKHIELKNLTLQTNRSRISNALGISYSSIKNLGKELGDMGINANFSNTILSVDDILMFAPQIKNQPILVANKGKTVKLTGKVTGKLKDLTASYLRAEVTGGTMVAVRAHIKGLPDAINAFYDVKIDSLHTTAADINLFSGNKIPASVRLPNSVSLTGTVKGSIKDAAANLHLRTSEGGADIDAKLKMFAGDTVYTVALQTHALDIGYILKMDTLLGPVTIKADVKGRNFNPATMSDSLVAVVESIQFRGQTYDNINITATADSNVFTANVSIKDTALTLDLA
ncbi:MAG TPA: AsmA family protein, partial [Chitinophagales bacterium]|nr:AsmA family protein [Chitinophagales bacterium]